MNSKKELTTSNSGNSGSPNCITIGYRGTFAFGRDGLADVKFRKLNRLLVSGKVRNLLIFATRALGHPKRTFWAWGCLEWLELKTISYSGCSGLEPRIFQFCTKRYIPLLRLFSWPRLNLVIGADMPGGIRRDTEWITGPRSWRLWSLHIQVFPQA